MRPYPFIVLLQKLNATEIKDFIQRISNQQETAGKPLKILKVVVNYYYPIPQVENPKLQLYLSIYDRHPNDKLRKELSNYLSVLNQQLEEFLILSRIKQDKRWYHHLLAQEVIDRGATPLFQRQINKLNHQITRHSLLGREQQLLDWQSSELTYFYPSTDKSNGDSEAFQQMVDKFEHFSLDTQFCYLLEMKFRQIATQQSTTTQPNETALVKQLEKQPSPLRNFYLQLLQYLSKPPHEKAIQDLWRSYQELIIQLVERERLILFGFMINAIAYYAKTGEESAYTLALKAYQHGLSKGILTIKGYMTSTQFCTISYLASRNKETIWARKFIKKYQHLLLVDERKPIATLAAAEVDFAEHSFLSALQKVEDIKMGRDVNFKIRKRSLQLRSLIELQQRPYKSAEKMDYDFAAYCRSFAAFAERSKQMSPLNRASCLNFIRIAKLLFYAIDQPISSKALKEEVEKINAIFSKPWLLEKIAENKYLS